MEMSTIIAIAIGFLINLWIAYEIIKSATKSTRQTKLLEAQLKLLRRMAIQAGVDPSEIKKDLEYPELKKS